MAQWFGPRGFTSSVPELDVRVGGALRIVMHGPDGNDYPMKGVFREVVPPERLVFTNIAVDKDGNHLLEGETTVILEEQDGKTKLTLHSLRHRPACRSRRRCWPAWRRAGPRASTSWRSWWLTTD